MNKFDGVNYIALDAVLRHSDARPNEKIVLMCIARFINMETGLAYPSVGTIAKLTRYTERQVRRNLRALEERGELESEIAASEYETNVYRLPKLDRWVNMSAKLPDRYREEVVVVEDREGRKIPMKKMYMNRSRTVILSESLADGAHEKILALAYRFMDALIAEGRHKLRYRSDAMSDEWINDIDRLLWDHPAMTRSTPTGLKQALEETERLLDYAARSDIPGTDTPIRNTQQVRASWKHLREQMLREDGAANDEQATVTT